MASEGGREGRGRAGPGAIVWGSQAGSVGTRGVGIEQVGEACPGVQVDHADVWFAEDGRGSCQVRCRRL
jgi:hypothetical protein